MKCVAAAGAAGEPPGPRVAAAAAGGAGLTGTRRPPWAWIPGTPNSIWPSLSASFLGKRMSFLLCDAWARPGLCADKWGSRMQAGQGETQRAVLFRGFPPGQEEEAEEEAEEGQKDAAPRLPSPLPRWRGHL